MLIGLNVYMRTVKARYKHTLREDGCMLMARFYFKLMYRTSKWIGPASGSLCTRSIKWALLRRIRSSQ
jgi:hypothetical protein